jgi:hypothetical protein
VGGIFRADGPGPSSLRCADPFHETRGNPRGRSLLRPCSSDRVASLPRLKLRLLLRLRGSTVPVLRLGSGEARCDVVRCAPSLVAACRVESRLRPTFFTGVRSAPRAIRLRCRLGLAPADNEGAGLTPSGVRSVTGRAVVRFEWLGGFAPQIRRKLISFRESSTSRCGNTL